MSIFNKITLTDNSLNIKKYIDVTKIDEDVIPCIVDENGNHIGLLGNKRLKDKNIEIVEFVIHPKRTFKQLLYIIDMIKNDSRTSFLSIYLEKPIIFTYEINTACTDGNRIYMSPVFAEDMYIKDSLKKFEFTDSDEGRKLRRENNFEYSKLTLIKLTRSLKFVIIHECFHMVLQHIRRERLHLKDNRTKTTHELANEAQDIEINRDIERSFTELKGITEELHGCRYNDPAYGKIFKKEIFEQIYDYLQSINYKPEPTMMTGEDQLEIEQDDVDTEKHYQIGWDFAFDSLDSGKLTFDEIENAIYALS